ncbi:MAG: MarR family EPS-associated transcriptional regulator [Pseudomonadota bacterium]
MRSRRECLQEDVRFRVLRLLEQNPELSQRDLARELGVSLGAINYSLNALAEKGQVKIRNFRASNKKMRYAYVLTPRGVAERTALTGRFLQRKLQEFEALRNEIAALERENAKDTNMMVPLRKTPSPGDRL